MSNNRYRILTNFMGAPSTVELEGGVAADVVVAETWAAVRAKLREVDAVVVDCRDTLIYRIAIASLLRPWRQRTPIVAVDLVLRRPATLRARVLARIKRLLFSQVHLFINYFRDVSGYTRYFGIAEARTAFVPFKPNNPGIEASEGEGEYVFTMGRSLRDYDTFIRAIQGLPVPAAISQYSFESFEGRDARFRWTLENIPTNLKVLRDGGQRADLLQNLRAAKIVVIPIQGDSLCASGLSTYLDAMNLGKCVVLTEGPGASDVLTEHQALFVPPHDVEALRRAIMLAWNDGELRAEVASAGMRYARSLGGERDLIERVLAKTCESLGSRAAA